MQREDLHGQERQAAGLMRSLRVRVDKTRRPFPLTFTESGGHNLSSFIPVREVGKLACACCWGDPLAHRFRNSKPGDLIVFEAYDSHPARLDPNDPEQLATETYSLLVVG